MSTISSSNGTVAGVSSDGRALGEQIVRGAAEANIVDKGWAFCLYDNAVTPTADLDVFCRIANTSSDNFVVTKIVGRSATADLWTVQLCANYTSATSHADGPTPANLRADKATSNLFSAKGTFESDVDITGDSGAVIVARFNVPILGDKLEHANGMPVCVVPPGYSMLLETVTGGFVASYEVYGYFDLVPHVTD